jgi:predicted nucleotidyltransferase
VATEINRQVIPGETAAIARAVPNTLSARAVCYDSPVGIATSAELLATLSEHAAEIRGLGAESLRLFGSFARGEQRPDSDLDLLVAFAPGEKTYDRFLALSLLLEGITGRRVELVTTEALSPYIGPKIQRESLDVPLGH